MTTLNLVLTCILIAMISLIFGYEAGKITGRKEVSKSIENLMNTAKKFGDSMKDELK